MKNGNFQGREVVIVEAVRTPIGRGHEEKGYYRDVHASNLLASVYSELIERAGIDASEVDDVVAGCVQQFGEQGYNIGRNAWLEAGLPVETPAATVDRQCGSAQQGVNFAAAMLASGVHDVAVGAGVEHMGHISFADGFEVMKEHGSAFSPVLMERYNLVPQGISAELIADKWEIPRSELDEIGLRSHQLAHRATEEGRFEREIMPYTVNGDTYVTDQGIRPDTTLEKLAALKPRFRPNSRLLADGSQFSSSRVPRLGFVIVCSWLVSRSGSANSEPSWPCGGDPRGGPGGSSGGSSDGLSATWCRRFLSWLSGVFAATVGGSDGLETSDILSGVSGSAGSSQKPSGPGSA